MNLAVGLFVMIDGCVTISHHKQNYSVHVYFIRNFFPSQIYNPGVSG